jgi:hypothetical protein
MISGLDSARPPSAAEALTARAAGYGIWSGYLATRPNTGVSSWSKADFDNARLTGFQPIAYWGGFDDPAAVRTLAAAWNVKPCLDCEDGIRPSGPWTQPALDAAGGGLYGGGPTHEQGFRAQFYVVAAYPTSGNSSAATWTGPAPRPNAPCGWQWRGTHSDSRIGSILVDDSDFDPWFGGGTVGDMDETDRAAICRGWYAIHLGRPPDVPPSGPYGPPPGRGGNHHFWADHWAAVGGDRAYIDFLTTVEASAEGKSEGGAYPIHHGELVAAIAAIPVGSSGPQRIPRP